MKTMDWYMSTIWTVIFNDPSSILPVQRPKTSKYCQHLQVTQFWFGPRIWMTPQARATTESTLCSTSESTKAKTGLSSLSSTTKSKMLFGYQMVKSSLWFRGSSPPQPRCTTLMVSQLSSLENGSETRWRSAPSATQWWLAASATSPKARWTSGALKISKSAGRPRSSHALRKWNGLHVADTSWHRYFTKDWKSIIASKSLEQMVRRSSKSL